MIGYHAEVIDGKSYMVFTNVDLKLYYKYRKQIKRMCGMQVSGWDYK